MNNKFPSSGYIREKQLIPDIVPISHATLWRWSKDGTFPAPVRLSARVTAWEISAVRAWLDARKGA
jgi:predicted DNA-binding transcriptional regulator AlpA